MANQGHGYIGRQPSDSSVIVARQQYTPSGVTTDFTFSSGYTVGYIDAYPMVQDLLKQLIIMQQMVLH